MSVWNQRPREVGSDNGCKHGVTWDGHSGTQNWQQHGAGRQITLAGDMPWGKAGDGQAETNIIYLGVFTVPNTGTWPVFVGLVSTRTYLRHEVICSAL